MSPDFDAMSLNELGELLGLNPEANRGRSGDILMPVSGVVGSGFHDRRAGGRVHRSGDIGAPAGTPVTAPGNMKFLYGRQGGTNLNSNDWWAHFQDVDTGMEYRFAHIGDISHLKPGQVVPRGEDFTVVGSAIKGPHLHMSVVDPTTGQHVDWLGAAKLSRGATVEARSILARLGDWLGPKAAEAAGKPPEERSYDDMSLVELAHLIGDPELIKMAMTPTRKDYRTGMAGLDVGEAFVPAPPDKRRPAGIYAERPGVMDTVRDYLGYRPMQEYLPMFNRETGTWEAKRRFEARKLYHGWEDYTEVERVALRGLSGVTMGATDYLQEEFLGEVQKPESIPGTMAGEGASLAGFLASPLGLARSVLGTRLAPTRSGLRGIAQLMAEGGASLGLASTLSAIIPSLMESDSLTEAALGVVKGGAAGALVGVMFPVLGANTGGKASTAARTAAGLAVMDFARTRMRGAPDKGWFTIDDVVRGALDGSIDRRDLAHKTFEYLMDLYFIAKTPTMKKSLERLKVNALMAEAAKVNAREAEEDLVAIGKNRLLVDDNAWRAAQVRRFLPGMKDTLVMNIARDPELYREVMEFERLAAGREQAEAKPKPPEMKVEDNLTNDLENIIRGEPDTPEDAARRAELEAEATGKETPSDTELGLIPPGSQTRGDYPYISDKKPWEMTAEEYAINRRAFEARHEDIKPKTPAQVAKLRQRDVAWALRRGEKVPPEVLADFPDLAKKYEKQVEKLPAPPAPGLPEGVAEFQKKFGTARGTKPDVGIKMHGGGPETADIIARLKALKREYFKRTLTVAAEPEAAAAGPDRVLLAKAAYPGISDEAAQRIADSGMPTDYLYQRALKPKAWAKGTVSPGPPEGTPPAAPEAAADYAVKAQAAAGRLVDWLDKHLERGLPEHLRDPDVGRNLGGLLLRFQQFEDIGRTYPEAKPFFQAARNGLVAKMRLAQEFYELTAPYATQLTPEERSRVDQVLVKLDADNNPDLGREFRLGDDLDVWRSYLKQPSDKVQELGINFYLSQGLTEKEARGALGVRLAMDYSKAQHLEWHTRSFREWLEAHGFEPGKIKDVMDMVLNSDMAPEAIAKAYFGPEPGSGVVGVLARTRETMQYWLKETHHYIPHSRYGEYFVRAFDQTGEVVYAAAAESKAEYHELYARVKAEYPEPEFTVGTKLQKRLPMEIFAETHIPRVWRIVTDAANQRRMPEGAKEAMMEAWQDFLAAKGFGAHYIRRMNIPGYRTDLQRPIADYLAGLAGYIGKMEKIRGFSEAYQKIPQEMPVLFQQMNDYCNYVLSNPYEYQGYRNLIFQWTLGGNLSFHFINATQNLTTGWAVLGKQSRRPLMELADAMKDWGRYLTTGEGLREGEEAVLARARYEPELAPSGVGELSGRAYNPLYRWLHNDPTSLVNKGLDGLKEIWSGSFVEKMNRESFFLAAWRTTGDYDQAVNLTRDAHFLYGKETRPAAARGAGSLPFIFMTYTTNYFTLAKNFAKGVYGVNPEVYGTKIQGVQGLARMLAAGFITGGLTGTFLWPFIRAAYQKVFGGNAEEDGKRYLQEVFGETAGEFGMRLLVRGLPAAALGMDVSARVAPNLPLMNLGPEGLTPGNLLLAATGAASMPLQRAGQAAKAAWAGEYGRTAEFLAPVSMGNVLAAGRLARRGATTMKGAPLYTEAGEPLKLTMTEAMRKAMGFQPVRLSEYYGKARFARDMEQERRDKMQGFAGELARAIREQDETGFDRTVQEWVDYNNRMLQAGREADVIGEESMQRALESRFKPRYPDVSEKKLRLREKR